MPCFETSILAARGAGTKLASDSKISPLDSERPLRAGEPSNTRLIRLPEVMQKVGLKRTAIYQRMREDRFPRSRSLGPRCTVWVEAEIDEWIKKVAHSC